MNQTNSMAESVDRHRRTSLSEGYAAVFATVLIWSTPSLFMYYLNRYYDPWAQNFYRYFVACLAIAPLLIYRARRGAPRIRLAGCNDVSCPVSPQRGSSSHAGHRSVLHGSRRLHDFHPGIRDLHRITRTRIFSRGTPGDSSMAVPSGNAPRLNWSLWRNLVSTGSRNRAYEAPWDYSSPSPPHFVGRSTAS